MSVLKLEKAGYIKQYVALLNTDLLNKNIIVFMNITIKDHHKEARDKFVQRMEALDEVAEFYHTSGKFDFLAKVRFTNIKECRDFLVNQITAIRNINSIDSPAGSICSPVLALARWVDMFPTCSRSIRVIRVPML